MDYEKNILTLLQIAVEELQRFPKDYDSQMQWHHYVIFAQCLTHKDYIIDKKQKVWKVIEIEKR